MDLVLVGLDYKTAPVALRERFYLADDSLHVALSKLKVGGLEEVVIVSTCNRLEIFGLAEDADSSSRMIAAFLADSRNTPVKDLDAHLYILQGRDAAQHLMRVASGLESQILGETQILGQVSHALAQAHNNNTDGTILSRLFTAALHTGKRARTETDISRHTLSLSHAAVQLVEQQIDLSTSVRVLVVGAGQMAELAVKALQAHDITDIRLINRTDSKAKILAAELGVQALAWADLTMALHDADVVIAATSASRPIIRAEHLLEASSEQRKQQLLLVDIGLPRNIDPNASELANVHLYDIDHLQNVVEVHRSLRQSEITHVESIISDELNTFMDWLHSREVVPLITELRLHAEALAQIEIDQALNRLPDINPHEQEVITQMAHRIVNKLLHAPTVNLKSRAMRDYHYDYAHAVRELFDLDEKAVERMKDA